MKIAVYDNDIDSAVYIINSIENCMRRYNQQYEIMLYTDKDELLLDHNKYSIFFISTDFKDADDAALAKIIKLSSPDSRLIFVSGNQRGAYKAIQYQPFAFIRKAYMDIDISDAVSTLVHEINGKGKLFTFRTENSTVNLNINDISYFETFGHTIEINLKDKIIPVRDSLRSLENQFSQYGFLRIHKSYLVNCRFVYSVSSRSITLHNMKTLPVGKGRANEIRDRLKLYLDKRSMTYI